MYCKHRIIYQECELYSTMSQDREPVDTVITINLRFKNSHSKRFKLLSGLATQEVGRKRIREAI